MEWLIISISVVLAIIFSILNFTYKAYKDWNITLQWFWRSILILVPMSTIFFIEKHTIFSTFVYIMLFFALIGDLLIIKNLLAGLIAFFICHALNSINFFVVDNSFSNYSIIIGTGVYAFGLYIFTMLFLGKIKGLMGILVPIYLVVILCSVWRSYVLFLDGNFLQALLVSIGTTLFFFTDAQVANESLLNNRILNNYNIDQTMNNIFYYGSLICLTASVLV